ncbi:MAG: hypothetical protein V5A27_09685 [Halapricum sp.]
MTWRETLRDAWTVTRIELRTYLRRLSGSRRQLLAVAGMLAAFGVFFPLTFAPGAIAFGEQLAGGSVPIGSAGYAFWALAGLAGYVGAAGGFNQTRVGTVGPLIRTSIPPIAVSLGRFGTRTAQSLGIVLPAALVLLAGVAIGGGPAAAALVAVAATPIFAAALISGRIVGDLARYANERLQVSLWVKAGVLLGVMVAIFLATQLLLGAQYEDGGGFGALISGAIVPGTPVQSYASVAFAPFGSTPDALGIAIAWVVLAVIPVGLSLAVRLEAYMLVHDIGDDATADRVEGTHSVPGPFEVAPATRVAWRYLLRTRRDPRTLAHLSPLLFGAFGLAGSAVQDPGIVLTVGPGAAVVAGAVLSGTAYCLNPLGDDRDQLPLLLTSVPSLGVMLRGRMLAGIVLGLVVAIGVGAPLALVEYGPVYILGQSLLAVVLALASAGIAVGLGAVVPKFERREYMSVERAHPSQWAMLGFFFGGLIVGAIGFGLLWVTLSGPSLPIAFGWLVYLVVLAITGWGGYRYALRKVDAFTLDDVR